MLRRATSIDAQPCVRAERPSATLPGALVAPLLGARSTPALSSVNEGVTDVNAESSE